MTTAINANFGRLRSVIWPIHRSEFKKFFPMLLIYALIVFNYSLLKAAKDALLITAPESGAATIPYIKLWVILPMAFLSTLIFTRLSNRYTREKVFYIMMCAFLIFFVLFITVLYPLQSYLHPQKLANQLQSMIPSGLQGFIAIFRNWTFTLFYVMSELWGTLIMTVLFWGFANEVTDVKEAKRFYSILGVGANIATIFAGQIGMFISSKTFYSKFALSNDRWGQSLVVICTLIIVSGVATVIIYRHLTHNVFKKEIVDSKPLQDDKSLDLKMGMRKNFAYLSKSKYLICIALIVVTYNIALNMVEVVWKHQIHVVYPYAADYNMYMGKVLTYIGVVSTLFALFICGQTIRRFGWSVSAYVTPVILLVTGILFFAFLLFRNVGFVGTMAGLMGATPIILSAHFGSLQNCLSRASKFTFFDVTKEIAFIPLNKESKLKGKAAIDGVGSRLGKSGGSLIHQLLLLAFGTISASAPYVAILFTTVIAVWILSVKSLGVQFDAITSGAKPQAPTPVKGADAETPTFAHV